MGDLTENFSAWEFACPCCQRSHMHPDFMTRFQALRTEYGKPLTVPSGGGYRCSEYDKSQGAHPEGRAVDPEYPRGDHFAIMALAFKHGFTGIGDKQKDGEYQMHLDDAHEIVGVRPRPWKWTYESAPTPR